MEQLDKVMMSYKTNGDAHGKLEVTFLCEFRRNVRLREVVVFLANSNDFATLNVAKTNLESDNDRRGTIVGMARELEKCIRDITGAFNHDLCVSNY